MDLFVVPECRGRGIAKGLMEVILAHPDLESVQTFMLGTLDAHGLYARFGFAPIREPQRLMRRRNPNVGTSA